MEITLKSLQDSIADTLGKPNDYVFKRKLIGSILGARATLIRQEYTKIREFPTYAVFEMQNVEIESTKEDICGFTLKCPVYRTVLEIPEPIYVKNQNPFKAVYSMDRMMNIGYIEPEEIEYFTSLKFSGTKPRYTWINRRVYLFNTTPDGINILNPADNITELAKFTCKGQSCFNEEVTVIIPGHLRQPIIELVYKELGVRNPETQEIRLNESN
jgi:hypothetical protein